MPQWDGSERQARTGLWANIGAPTLPPALRPATHCPLALHIAMDCTAVHAKADHVSCAALQPEGGCEGAGRGKWRGRLPHLGGTQLSIRQEQERVADTDIVEKAGELRPVEPTN